MQPEFTELPPTMELDHPVPDPLIVVPDMLAAVPVVYVVAWSMTYRPCPNVNALLTVSTVAGVTVAPDE